MSDLTAKDFFENLKENGEFINFTTLTKTGISSDYESVFQFAEDYHNARESERSKTSNESEVCDHKYELVHAQAYECIKCGDMYIDA